MTDREPPSPNAPRTGIYPGYIIVGLSFIVMTAAMGLFNAFGVLFNPLLDEFGWTSAMTAGAFSLSMVVRGAGGILMGGVTDRFGPRIVLVGCGISVALGYFLMSRIDAVWQFYIVYGVLIGGGMAGIWVPLLSSIARWFDRRRALMTGIVVSGVGIGGLIVPPVLTRLIETTDWRIAYIIQAGLVLVFISGAGLFFRRPTSHLHAPAAVAANTPPVPAGQAIREALTTGRLWLVILVFFCSGYGAFTIMVHLVPHAENMGISPLSASTLLAVMNGISLVGILGLGSALGDRLGGRRVFQIAFIAMLAGMLVLLFAGELWALYIFAALFGIAVGALGAAESPLIAQLFGMKSHGMTLGLAGIGFTGGTAVGPLVTGLIYDATGEYMAAFIVTAAVAVLGFIVISLIRPVRREETVTGTSS